MYPNAPRNVKLRLKGYLAFFELKKLLAQKVKVKRKVTAAKLDQFN